MSTPTTPRKNDKSAEVTSFVQSMLDELENEFTEAENSMLGKMDAMGKRMDDLERSITDLMADAGLDANETEGSRNRTAAHSQLTPPSIPSKEGSTVL